MSGFFFFCHSCQIGIDHDTTAVLTHDDFLVHLYFHLFLRGDTVEASAAGVALDIYDAETVARIFADALECREGAGVDHRLESLGLFAQALFVLLGLRYDFFEFGALLCQNMFLIFQALFGSGDFGGFCFYHAGVFVDVLFRKLDFESLEFDFLGEKVEFAVVSDVVDLRFVLVDFCCRVVEFLLLRI